MESIGMDKYYMELENISPGDVIQVLNDLVNASHVLSAALNRRVCDLRRQLLAVTTEVVALAAPEQESQ